MKIRNRIHGEPQLAPSPSMIVALLALFVAMGGTTYAAINLPANSVGTKQLKNAAVSNSKLKNGAVGTNKLADRAVTRTKLNVTGLTVPDAIRAGSATTAANAANADHATNANHAAVADNATHADSATGAVTADNANALGGQSADSYRDRCPSGTVAVTGLCFETAEQAASVWAGALRICAQEGRRLPTAGELQAYGYQYGTPDQEWAGGVYFASVDAAGPAPADATWRAVTYKFTQGGGSVYGSSLTTIAHPYRCVTNASN